MNNKFATLAIATAVAAFTGAVSAQQMEQFGRASVYPVPGKASSEARTPIVNMGYGRDSVYASPTSGSSTSGSANTAGVQRLGRDGVYAAPFQYGSPQPTSTARTSGTDRTGG
jgi:hypothetical protein